MNNYTVATLIDLKGTFAAGDGTLIDPDIVKVQVRAPDGTVTTFEGIQVTRLSLGVYQVQYTARMNGLHQYRFAGYDNPGAEPITSFESSFLAESDFIGQGAP